MVENILIEDILYFVRIIWKMYGWYDFMHNKNEPKYE